MTEGEMDELSQRLAGEDVSAEEMKQRLEKTEVTQHEEEALVEITELFKEMETVEGEERRKTSESIVQAAKRWPEKVGKHSEQLVDFVTDDNYYVRKNATFALGLVGDERHLDFLKKVAQQDEDLEDVARWSVKRIKAEGGLGGEEEPVGREDSDVVDEGERQHLDTGDIGGKSGGNEEPGADTTSSDEGLGREDRASDVEASESEGDTREVSMEDDAGEAAAGNDGGEVESTEAAADTGEVDDGVSKGQGASSSERTRRSGRSSDDESESEAGIYREMAMTLYGQGEGHREAVEQAAVQVVSRDGSVQPLVDALDGGGDEALFAARTLERVSEDDAGSLRDDVSRLSDAMSEYGGEVADHLEEALVNVARETPESLVEELSKRR